jgi:hypothetical protein
MDWFNSRQGLEFFTCYYDRHALRPAKWKRETALSPGVNQPEPNADRRHHLVPRFWNSGALPSSSLHALVAWNKEIEATLYSLPILISGI